MTTILVHEWVTGGGLAGLPLPSTWAAEGDAMRRAIAADFAALPGTRVVVTRDDRFPDSPETNSGPALWTSVRIGAGQEQQAFARFAAQAHYTVLIAPETGGILADRARTIDRVGGRSLGATPEAIATTGDKLVLGRHLADRGIATPVCRRVSPRSGLPADAPYPAVLKPVDGAGSQDTYFVRDPDTCPDAARVMTDAVLQPWYPGVPMSASFLVGTDGQAHLIAASRQHMEVLDDRFLYRGGTVPVTPHGVDLGPRQAVESVPGLRGYVGVDYLWDEALRSATVLEINPRPTTSYVGLVRWLPPGNLARAWLAVVVGSGASDPFTPTFPRIDRGKSVTFAADGGMMEYSEGTPDERSV